MPSTPGQDRDAVERRIIILLAGERAERYVDGVSIHRGASDEEAAALMALTALEDRSPRLAELLRDAEAEPSTPPDWPAATWKSRALHDYDASPVIAHMGYMLALTDALLNRHGHAIRAVARALDERTVLDDAEVVGIMRDTRCVCHRREWVDRERLTVGPLRRVARKPEVE